MSSNIIPAGDAGVLGEARGDRGIVPHASVWLANFPSPNTKRTYQRGVVEFMHFHGLETEEQLKQTRAQHVIAWRDSLHKGGATPRTIHTRLSALSSLFDSYCKEQLITDNPVRDVKRQKVKQSRVEAITLTPKQVRTMLDAPGVETIKGLRDTAIFHIMFYTGCRISEVATLKVCDFFEDEGYGVLDFIIKGGKRNRVAINQEALIALRRYVHEAGHATEKDAPLFLAVQRSDLRKPLTSRQLNYIFCHYAAAAGLPERAWPHCARATFITESLAQGAALEAVQHTVGHEHISTTQKYDKRAQRHRDSASLVVHY